MKKTFNRKFNRCTYEVFAGDYYATGEKDVVLATLLGSCISVCLKDTAAGVVGINHFMLPRRVNLKEMNFSDDARYGIHAMEIMIAGMMELGAVRDSLQAKVFGGGRVMDTALSNVAQANIDFALTYLETEGIPVVASDVGGREGRKLYFFPDTFSVFIKRIRNERLQSAVLSEKRFLHHVRQQQQQTSELIIFNEKENVKGSLISHANQSKQSSQSTF